MGTIAIASVISAGCVSMPIFRPSLAIPVLPSNAVEERGDMKVNAIILSKTFYDNNLRVVFSDDV